MIISNELWRRIRHMKQEILDLKQVKKANSASKYYQFTTSGNEYYNTWLITYEAGTQPIITECLSYTDTILSAPSGNTQYIFSFSQATDAITVLSTRKILSVTGIS